MKEIALNLGPEGNLVAIITLPKVMKPVALLILNAGVIHRVGPYRSSVKLARYMAAQGFAAIRLDLSGLGDSRPPGRALPFREQAIRDVQAAMDYLEREHQLSAFGVYGICGGAVNAYWAALEDERIAAVFMMDGYAYPTLKSSALQFAERLRTLSVHRIPAILGRQALRLLPAGRLEHAAGKLADVRLTPPTREEFGANLERLVDRGVRVTFLYSGSGYRDYYCYPDQLRDAFSHYRFPRRVGCHYVPFIDHLVTTRSSQRALFSLVGEWMSSLSEHAATL